MIGLTELLCARGFAPTASRVKLVRHADARFDLEEIVRKGWLERYQQYQGKPIFDKCDQIVAFVGEEGMKSRFVGVFDIGKRRPATEGPRRPAQMPAWMDARYWYDVTRRPGFEDLENRVIINWNNARAWHQWFGERELLEIRALGRTLPPFRDYLKVHLSFAELQVLANESDAHQDWVSALRAVGGVYLIVSTVDGRQYVGSATGERGLWQRWSQYAKTGHCNNTRLAKLCRADSKHPNAFMFSILETFSRTTGKEVALRQEAFFKGKLGSRAFGLNEN